MSIAALGQALWHEVYQGEVKKFHNLGFTPLILRSSAREHPGHYVPLQELLSEPRSGVQVQETGTVSRLHIVNDSDQYVFAPSGMYLKGGKQDRMLTISVVLAPRAEQDVPVRCVEAGRWHHDRANSGFMIPTQGSLAASSMISGSAQMTEQSRVWDTVSDLSQQTLTHSQSQRLGDVYIQTQDYLKELSEAVPEPSPDKRVVGSLFVVGLPEGQMHWALNLFGKCQLFRAYFSALRDSAALVACSARDKPMLRQRTVVEAMVRAFQSQFTICQHEEVASLKCGRLLTGSHKGISLAVLEHEDQLLHGAMHYTYTAA